jgi:hypothetical protein
MWDIIIQNLPTIVLVALAGVICGAELIKAIRIWKEERDRRVNEVVEEQNQERTVQEALDDLNKKFDLILEKVTNIEARVSVTEERVSDLTISDMHDIKSWIVEQYHKFYNEQGWIDSFSAETIDRRYSDYQKEGGNSYISVLIDRLHSLPMDPPQNRTRQEEE